MEVLVFLKWVDRGREIQNKVTSDLSAQWLPEWLRASVLAQYDTRSVRDKTRSQARAQTAV